MPLRVGVFQCKGLAAKLNWLLVRHVPQAARSVVFFPGDISDFASTYAPYSYSLEGLLWVLCCKFPEDNVILVKPRMMREHFSIYVNFMQVDSMGNPRYLAEPKNEEADPPEAVAVDHLQLLLTSLSRELGEELPSPIVLLGFSKGGAVLNALMREPKAMLWSRVQAVHFIDTGLTVPGVFPMNEEELRHLKDVVQGEFEIWLHCTPRQLEDPGRPFVAKEHDEFEERCRALGFVVHRRLYGQGLPISLDMHFDALRCFYTSQTDQESGTQHCGFFRAWQQIAEAAESEG